MKKLAKRTKIKVTSGDISFFTTVDEIREDLGTLSNFNLVAKSALLALEKSRDVAKDTPKPIGLSGNWLGIAIQLDIVV